MLPIITLLIFNAYFYLLPIKQVQAIPTKAIKDNDQDVYKIKVFFKD